MTNPIDHNQAFTDSKFRELLHGPDKVPNIYAAYLDLRKEIDELLEAMQEVLRISDRKHDAWDKAYALIARMENLK